MLQNVVTSPTQMSSQAVVQQYASIAHTAAAQGLHVAPRASPFAQIECVQLHGVPQVTLALSTHACVKPCVQHEGIAAQTATTHGSGPQSCDASAVHEASHVGLPPPVEQHSGFCAQTGPAQGSMHEVTLSAAPVTHTE